jgi:hydrogenase maturation protease
MDKILIVGIGNLLCRDEGIGVHVIQEMEKIKLPDHIELLDMGTSTMDLISYLEGVKKLIAIDAMKAGGAPGTIYKCRPEDLLPKGGEPISLHDIGVIETLTMAKRWGWRSRPLSSESNLRSWTGEWNSLRKLKKGFLSLLKLY